MELVFIYGPPACGKHAIGEALQSLTGYRFFHNHLVVDAVLSLFDFGTPSFISMREKLWRMLMQEAVDTGVKGVIFTFNPENTVPPTFVHEWINDLRHAKVNVHLVKVACPENVLEQRIDQPSRRLFKKMTSLSLYRELRDAGAFADDWMPEPHLRINSETLTPLQNAENILDFIRKGTP